MSSPHLPKGAKPGDRITFRDEEAMVVHNFIDCARGEIEDLADRCVAEGCGTEAQAHNRDLAVADEILERIAVPQSA